jgi:hypothetical protein
MPNGQNWTVHTYLFDRESDCGSNSINCGFTVNDTEFNPRKLFSHMSTNMFPCGMDLEIYAENDAKNDEENYAENDEENDEQNDENAENDAENDEENDEQNDENDENAENDAENDEENDEQNDENAENDAENDENDAENDDNYRIYKHKIIVTPEDYDKIITKIRELNLYDYITNNLNSINFTFPQTKNILHESLCNETVYNSFKFLTVYGFLKVN